MNQYLTPNGEPNFRERLQDAIANLSTPMPLMREKSSYRNICRGFSDFCNEVSASLPKGYQVRMIVECGGYGIEVILPDGTIFSPDNDNMINCIEDAVAYATIHKRESLKNDEKK